MSTALFSFLKKLLFFIVFLFALPLSLMAQDVRSSSETSLTLETNSSNQLGDIVFTPVIGNLKVLFILVKYPGDDGSGLFSSFQDAQDHADIVESTLEWNSYDKMDVTIDITWPTLTMPNPDSYYQSGGAILKIRTDAIKVAEQAGFDVDSTHREVIFSRQLWGGPAAIGINKRTVFMSHTIEPITVHELGHTFGWRHANFLSLTGSIEYGDKYDMMGGRAGPLPHTESDYHHFNPWLKHRVGWIPKESILTVTNSGTYTLQALASTPQTGTSVTKYTALRIRRDPRSEYWIFFRSLEPLVKNGAVITLIINNNINSTNLLDMTPGSQTDDWRDAALKVGETFSDTQAGITVKTVSVSSGEIQVDVTVDANAQATIDNLPVIDLISPIAGETVTGFVDFEATAFDPDIGNTNGAGIAKLEMFFHFLTDPLQANLALGLDPPNPDAKKEFTAPPYQWQFDTNSGSPFVKNGRYWFVLKATSVQGGKQVVIFEHLVDNLALPAAPSLSSPLDNAIDILTNTTLSWNLVSGAASYWLQVSTSSIFLTTLIDQSGITGPSFQLTGLLNNITYYWRVRATDSAGSSPWSTAWKFKTIVAPPAAPVLSSPTENATDIPTNPTLTWNQSSAASSYQVQVSTDSNFATIEIDQSGIATTSFQITTLSNSTTYFWRVKATNTGGTSPWSAAWKFTTIGAGPAAPVLASPTDNATDIATNPNLTWNTVSDATSYQAQLSASSDFLAIVVDESGIPTFSFQATGLSNSSTYFWRVRATNAGGTSPWSTVWQFTTIIARPAAPVLTSPADNASDVSRDPVLVWNDSDRAESYSLQVATRSDFLVTDVDQSGITATSFQVMALGESTDHFWRVNATNAGGTSNWSATWKFRTEKATSVETGGELPEEFSLGQNYPNPFNSTTNISFELPEREFVVLKIYNLLGIEIVTLISEDLPAGKHIAQFNAGGLATGVYLYKIQTSSFVQTKKMLLVR